MSKEKKGAAYLRKNGRLAHRKSIRINGIKFEEYFTRKTDADRWYLERKREKELAKAGFKPQLILKNLGLFVEEWLVARKMTRPVNTWKSEHERLKKFILPRFSVRNLHEITTGEWEVFLDGLVTLHKRSPATRNRYRTLLHKIYEDAQRKDFAAFNPIKRIPKWRENTNPTEYFETLDECKIYLIQAKREKLFSLFAMIALNTGARLGEILALRNRDVDLAMRRIRIWQIVEYPTKLIQQRTKGRKERIVGISDDLYEAILDHKKAAKFNKPDDLLICNSDGTFCSASSFLKTHLRVCKEAGLKRIRIHDLRHSFASHYMMNGGNLYDLQKILGHSSYSMVQRYAHLGPNHVLSKANVVSMSAAPKLSIVKENGGPVA